MIFKQMELLKQEGLEVTCFSAFVDRKNCFPEEISNYDIRQIPPIFLNKFIPHDLMIILVTLLFPLAIFKFRNFDIFLGENQAGPWWAFLAAEIFRRPFLIYQNYPPTLVRPREIDRKAGRRTSLPTALFLKILKPLIIKFDYLVASKAVVILGNGEYARKVLEETYRRKIVVCPAGTEKKKFNQEIFKKRFYGRFMVGSQVIKKPYLLITNRHFPAKRLDYGILTISNLKNPWPRLPTSSRLGRGRVGSAEGGQKSKFNLVITGAATPYTREIKRSVGKYQLQDKVIFTGLVSEKDLDHLYQNALVYLYTAPEEDFGLGIIEAMAEGVPVVAWNKAGPAYIIKNSQTGYLAIPGDFSDFVAGVRILLDQKTNWQMALAAYKEAQKYSWENHRRIIIEEIKKIYEGIT